MTPPTAPVPPTIDEIRSLPKVALHDHLDGGLRPVTVLELCEQSGIAAPATTPAGVAEWFTHAADSGSLERYLETFDRTVALLQTRANLRRVAREFVADMVADHVVYAETRWAPEQHTTCGLTMAQAVAAVQEGIDEGVDAARATGHPIEVRQILAYLRQHEPTDELAEIAIDHRGTGVVGLDLAGPEQGFPASRFLRQFALARRHGLHLTVHAGEADGVASVRDALDCGAERLGHGVRLVEDLGPAGPGPVAARVRELGIPLEVCPSSNLQTGVCARLADHPVSALREASLRVAVSCDNRLMSGTSLTREFSLLSQEFGWSREDLVALNITALNAAFCDPETTDRLRRLITWR